MLKKISPNIYINKYNLFSDVLVINENKGFYVHCMKHCIKGTGCVLYEISFTNDIPDNISQEYIQKLELKPVYITKKALISINTLREASSTLKLQILNIASDKILEKMNEGLFTDDE